MKFHLVFLILLVFATTLTTSSAYCGIIMPGESAPLLDETVYSVRSRTIEFSVDAETKNGDYIRVTNEGGLISVKGRPFKLVPWNIVYDTKTKAWVLFLANVTSENFRIIYLYLRNGTGAFSLWYYDYDASSFEGYIFYGADHIKNKTSFTPSVQMPRLSIVPQAKHPSGISALGPSLFINDQGGLYVNRTETLSLYPILYRGFPGTSELWLLIDDHQGRYYYSIFYLFETDREHILRGHTLRLNDLYQAPFENIAAQWVPGLFPFSLTVTSDLSNVTVKINGFPFKTDKFGRIAIRVPVGDIAVEAQNEVTEGGGVRWIFGEWRWLTKSNPTLVRITQNTDLYLTYRTQFYLSLSSLHGSPMGEGWYDAGATARFSIEPLIDLLNKTRLVFCGWTGDQESSNSEGVTTVDRPKTLRANWKRQYEIQISTKGLPSGVTLSLAVNENKTTVTVPFTHRQWINGDSALMVNIYPANLTSSQTRFVFRRWETEVGATVTLPVSVKNPMQLIARYETEEPFTGKITLQATPATLLLGDTVTIKGTTSPSRSLTNVTILWSQDSVDWISIATIKTDSKGNYEYVWKVQQLEKIYFKARWTYDPDYEPLESSIAVVTRIVSTGGQQSQWPQFLRSLLRVLESVSVPSQVIAMLLYPLTKINEIATLLSAATGTPQWLQDVTTWVLTGALVGPVYFAPFLVLLALVWKRATHRSPSASWLMPVVTVAAIGVGLMLIGNVSSASTILQLGLALGTTAASLLTAYLIALAIAKIT